MKKRTILTSAVLALLLALSSVAALADLPNPAPNVMPIANGDVTLSIYVGMPNEARQQYVTLNDHPVVQKISEDCGLKFDFIHPPQGDDGTFFNTLIASGQYPDIFSASFVNYFEGEHLVLINRDPTPQDRYASLIIRDPIARVLGAL